MAEAVDIVLEDAPGQNRIAGALEVLGDGPAGARARKRIGQMALADQRWMFRQRAARGGSFERVGFITALLRDRPSTPPMVDAADVEARRQRLQPLFAHTVLYRSLQPGAPGNVLVQSRERISVGTRDRRAALHQAGGQTTFVFDEKAQRDFDRNVSQTRRGEGGRPMRKPRRLQGGRRRRAGDPAARAWNPIYFQMRNWLTKVSGRSYEVPRRPIVVEPTPAQKRRYLRELLSEVRRALGRR